MPTFRILLLVCSLCCLDTGSAPRMRTAYALLGASYLADLLDRFLDLRRSRALPPDADLSQHRPS